MKVFVGLGSNRKNVSREKPDDRADIVLAFLGYKEWLEKTEPNKLTILDASLFLVVNTKPINKKSTAKALWKALEKGNGKRVASILLEALSSEKKTDKEALEAGQQPVLCTQKDGRAVGIKC